MQQNVDGSDFFNRSWAKFKVGFGNSTGNYWIGNDLLHQLTNSHRRKVTFNVQTVDGRRFYAQYSTFNVSSEADNYAMTVYGYSGNAGDAFSYNNHSMFSTYDRDNDEYVNNCAAYNGGGFWYKSCALANVNNARRHGDDFNWVATSPAHDDFPYLKSTVMWLTC